MAFYITLIELKKLLGRPGCPICALYRRSAEQYIQNLLWENVNDPETRVHFLASQGFCPEHTFLLAVSEGKDYGDWMGTNILYEHLNRVVSQLLELIERIILEKNLPSRRLSSLWRKWKLNLSAQPDLSRSETCRVCQMAESSEKSSLSDLLEVIDEKQNEFIQLYIHSDGLCFPHMKLALDCCANRYPSAWRFICAEAIRRLVRLSGELREEIQKPSGGSQAEATASIVQPAVQRCLAFFNGELKLSAYQVSPYPSPEIKGEGEPPVDDLFSVFSKPGCPICRIYHEEAERYIKHVLHDQVNQKEIPNRFLASLGYCPAHNRLLVKSEGEDSGSYPGVSILFEHLSREITRRLADSSATLPINHRWIDRLANWLWPRSTPPSPLAAQAACQVCQSSEERASQGLSKLLKGLCYSAALRRAYLESDGVCLAHLRQAVQFYPEEFREGLIFLIEDAFKRLYNNQKAMQAYIRKLTWEFKDEAKTEAEEEAWKRDLAFFTGYLPSVFDAKANVGIMR